MLWYKAWLETRSRFLIALTLSVALCTELVIVLTTISTPKEIMSTLSGVHVTVAAMWSLGAVLLTMGGLLRENTSGSAQFTLALPVSRLHLMLTQIGMALIESVALAAVPWFTMLLAARVVDKGLFLSQAAFHILLLLTGGVVFLSISLLSSSLIEGEYVAPVVAFGVIVMVAYAMSGKSMARYNPWVYMMGFPFLDRLTGQLTGPFPLLQATGYVAIALAVSALSVRIIQRKDF
jgi:ABC-2 type transport system permease protein